MAPARPFWKGTSSCRWSPAPSPPFPLRPVQLPPPLQREFVRARTLSTSRREVLHMLEQGKKRVKYWGVCWTWGLSHSLAEGLGVEHEFE
jgi:hypothetical protein